MEAMPVPSSRSVVVPKLTPRRPHPASTLWLEYQGAGSFPSEVRAGRSRRPPTASGRPSKGCRSTLDAGDRSVVGSGRRPSGRLAGVRPGPAGRPRWRRTPGFDQLICLPLVRDMELLEHQIRTAKTVLRRFRGRALLCDEVGLGKTIEAGLILAELLMRGLVRSVLVLVPPSLIEQWQGEMRRKFCDRADQPRRPGLPRSGAPQAWAEFDRVIASIHTAKREPHRSAILARKWDMVIVDEAHHLRNRTTAGLEIRQRAAEAVHPAADRDPGAEQPRGAVQPRHAAGAGAAEHARSSSRSQFVDRRDKLTPTQRRRAARAAGRGDGPQPPEHGRPAVHPALGADRADRPVAARARPVPRRRRLRRGHPRCRDRRAARSGGPDADGAVTLQMALGSSQAAAAALGNAPDDRRDPSSRRPTADGSTDLARPGRRPGRAAPRPDRLLRLLDEFRDKMVIFTQFRATQEMLRRRLREAGPRRGGVPRRAVAAGEGGGDRTVPRPGAAAALHRGRQRGPQPPVRPRRVQLRPALEPDEDRAAHRPAEPDRPDPRRPRLQPRRRRTRSRRRCSTCWRPSSTCSSWSSARST